jgi:hypothetical protein
VNYKSTNYDLEIYQHEANHLNNFSVDIINFHSEFETQLIEFFVGIRTTDCFEQMISDQGNIWHTKFISKKMSKLILNQDQPTTECFLNKMHFPGLTAGKSTVEDPIHPFCCRCCSKFS